MSSRCVGGHDGARPDRIGSRRHAADLPLSSEVRQDVEHGDDVLLAAAERPRGGQQLVGDSSRRERHLQAPALLEHQADVLLHQLDVEPRLIRAVEEQRGAKLQHR